MLCEHLWFSKWQIGEKVTSRVSHILQYKCQSGRLRNPLRPFLTYDIAIYKGHKLIYKAIWFWNSIVEKLCWNLKAAPDRFLSTGVFTDIEFLNSWSWVFAKKLMVYRFQLKCVSLFWYELTASPILSTLRLY